MKLTLREVARLFDVSENAVHRWIQLESLPVESVKSPIRFDQTELLEWATVRKIRFAPELLQAGNGNGRRPASPVEAFAAGKLVSIPAGSRPADLRTVLSAALDGLPLPGTIDRRELVELLVARELLGSTAVGDGIAIPHPRYPVILPLAQPVLRICYLAEPLDCKSPDGVPIDTLLLLLCPTVHSHLQLLARIALTLRDTRFHECLRARSPENVVAAELDRLEASRSA